MHRFIPRLVPLGALLLLVSGCSGSGDGAVETPTAPPPTQNETFTGILTLNGAITHPFTEVSVGSITAQLISLSPDADKAIGLSLGTWNGSICQIILANDASIQGSLVIGQTTTTGNFCVRVYDARGTVTQPQAYTVEVAHQ